MIENHERNAYILGALLHDVGKFVQRAQGPVRGRQQNHSKWGVEWFERNLAEKITNAWGHQGRDIASDCINNHHDYVEFVTLADGISAGEREKIKIEAEEGDVFNQRLKAAPSLAGDQQTEQVPGYIALSSLGKGKKSLEGIFPCNESVGTEEEYQELLDKFNSDIKSDQINFDRKSGTQIIDIVYYLLWKYTWCVPSAVYKTEADISLFDHLKVTAALTACLYDWRQDFQKTADFESKSFMLVQGDLSGIQDYIFGILNQHGKIAKRLRARSFYVQMLSEIASHKILHAFHLPMTNVLSSAGGNFTLLVPALKDTCDRLEMLRREMERWCFERFRGELNIVINWLAISGGQMNDYSHSRKQLKQDGYKEKHTAHRLILQENGGWNEEKFVLEEIIKSDEHLCAGCRKHTAEEDELCVFCRGDSELGAQLPRAEFLSFFCGDSNNGHFKIFDDFSFDLSDNGAVPGAYLTMALNNPMVGYGFKFISKHIPVIEDVGCTDQGHEHQPGHTALFDCIAGASHGDKILGVLKGDADNMGKIFSQDLTVSRYASLSRMFETFFSGYLNCLLEKEFKCLYCVFSGGDDFFVIGPWNRIIEFALRLREDFHRFVFDNPCLHFSAGIVLSKPHFPLSFMVNSVQEQLAKAKTGNKNAVVVFDHDQKMAWDELASLCQQADGVVKWHKSDLISRSLLHKFCQYGEMYDNYRNTGKAEYLKFSPLMTYDINRNLTRADQAEIKQWARQFVLTMPPADGQRLKTEHLRVLMDYVLTYTRGDNEKKRR